MSVPPEFETETGQSQLAEIASFQFGKTPCLKVENDKAGHLTSSSGLCSHAHMPAPPTHIYMPQTHTYAIHNTQLFLKENEMVSGVSYTHGINGFISLVCFDLG